MRLGPDSSRYMLAGAGETVASPFHLRILAPLICKDRPRRWLLMWSVCWPTLAGLMVLWSRQHGLGWPVAITAAVLLLGLPGVWGPDVVRPVGVDLPAMTLGLGAVVLLGANLGATGTILACVLAVQSGLTKESGPVWASLWAWNPILLLGLIGPALVFLFTREEIDKVTARPELRKVHDHPILTARWAHEGQWRDFWVMAAPFGATLACLYHPSLYLLVVLGAAFAQLLVATDTVRLLHTAAGPVVALVAASNLPEKWLLVAVVVHLAWLKRPQFI